jgi:transaldolase
MKPTSTLHDLGQSLWLDNITRELLNSGTLQRYIDELSVTGLTSNPTIFDHAIKNSPTYDGDISREASSTQSAEDLFFELALAELTRAVPARLRPDRRGRRLGVARGLTASGP